MSTAPESDENDKKMAQLLHNTLREMNLAGNFYAVDNTYRAKEGTDPELLPYALVQKALMQVLTRVAHGSAGRADELRWVMLDTDDITDALNSLSEKWKGLDRALTRTELTQLARVGAETIRDGDYGPHMLDDLAGKLLDSTAALDPW